MSLRQLSALTVLLACLWAPAAAQASPDQLSMMMDDDMLLYRDNVTQTRTLVTMRSMGVEVVRATILWRNAAQGADLTNKEIERIKGAKNRAKARKQRKRFRANNPRTYPTRNWDRYDNLVKEADKLGMRVYFTITGPGPSYAHKIAPRSQRLNGGTYRPYPTRFRSFVEAVGKRYSGTYRDENAIRKALPRVSMWSLWNEPNQAGWLSPQWERVDGDVVPVAPSLYRELHQAGVQGLERSGHGRDAIMLAETAPMGSDRRGPRNGMRPVPFLREMLCLKPDGTQYAGEDAARRRCHVFAKNPTLKATGFAHHPYTKKAAPTKAPKSPEDITMANIGSLGPLLDTLSAQSGGKMPAGLPIFLTEFGYETEPDPRNGISFDRQAEFIALAEFMAYNEPRVAATTQFLLRDAPPLRRSPITGRKYKKNSREYWFTYQSGLLNTRGRAKPGAYAYTFPLVLFPAAATPGAASFWGQARFLPNGAPHTVIFLWRPNPKAPWQQVSGAIETSPRGFFTGSVPIPGPGGEYSAAYVVPATETAPAKIGAYTLPLKLK